jgi:hypothetical protein
MSGRLAGLLGLVLLAAGCTVPASSSNSGYNVPRTRCLSAPQRGENYTQERPMFYLFCTESP